MKTITIIFCSITVLAFAVGCSQIRGAKEVETTGGAEGIGDGPGVMTGKRGGIVIFQK
jgi:succinate-acetate transporter protein